MRAVGTADRVGGRRARHIHVRLLQDCAVAGVLLQARLAGQRVGRAGKIEAGRFGLSGLRHDGRQHSGGAASGGAASGGERAGADRALVGAARVRGGGSEGGGGTEAEVANSTVVIPSVLAVVTVVTVRLSAGSVRV